MNLVLKSLALILALSAVKLFAANATGTWTNGTYWVFSQMTAPETTAVEQVARNSKHVWAVTVASINTSVTMFFEGSTDGTNWYNLDVNNTSTVLTANGTQSFKSTVAARFVRFRWSAEAGGVAATLDVTYYGGAQ